MAGRRNCLGAGRHQPPGTPRSDAAIPERFAEYEAYGGANLEGDIWSCLGACREGWKPRTLVRGSGLLSPREIRNIYKRFSAGVGFFGFTHDGAGSTSIPG